MTALARAIEQVLRRRDPGLVWTVTPHEPDTLLNTRPLPRPARTRNIHRLERRAENLPPLRNRERRPQISGDVEDADLTTRVRDRQRGTGGL